MKMSDNVNSPLHYKSESGLEVIDVLYLFGLQDNYNLSTAIAYLFRSGKKGNEEEDLRKALWYVDAEINKKERIKTAVKKAKSIKAEMSKGK
jgi:hypothetical protein